MDIANFNSKTTRVDRYYVERRFSRRSWASLAIWYYLSVAELAVTFTRGVCGACSCIQIMWFRSKSDLVTKQIYGQMWYGGSGVQFYSNAWFRTLCIVYVCIVSTYVYLPTASLKRKVMS